MFTKLTRSGGHTYVQLVESFRDETGRPRQRTISTLGRLDETGGADTADAKLAIMEACGFTVTRNPSEMAKLLKALL